ncbi:unnamed protein product [Paramecium pentaurelia]|uniref:Transmembrane protein n=1 Tax=Paramecium pentaurelia TaxID=43138 RepID=A0A8S1VJ00_9CILI|nr:unnamed protein product [Paramecium pentaurelia]
MIIFFLIIQKITMFKPEIKENDITLYPTQGEYFKFYINEILYLTSSLPELSSLTCNLNSQVPYVDLINTLQETYLTEGENFKSISSNITHFAALTYNNQVIIYEWINEILKQVGQTLNIDSSINCFSINLFLDSSILVDCYNNEQFSLMNIINAQSIIVYQAESYMPNSTEIQSIVNGTKNFIIYTQYFQNYSIISLFSEQFDNLSSFNSTFIDFDISNRINPYIYAINQQEIFQFYISEDYKFVQISNNTFIWCLKFTIINAYYNSKSFSQCDQIQVLCEVTKYNGPLLVFFGGCENSIIYQGQRSIDFSFQKVLQNNQFVIYSNYSDDKIRIYFYQEISSYQIEHIKNNSQLILNANNELFSFNKDIIVYKIQSPALIMNLTSQEIVQINENFKIKCHTRDFQKQFLFFIRVQVLSQNDTNIYVMFQPNLPQMQIISNNNNNIIVTFTGFSGQLLNYSLNSDEVFLNLQQTTFSNAGRLLQQYYLIKIISQYTQMGSFSLVGYNNQSLDFYYCQISIQGSTQSICQQQNSIEISINAFQLQIALSIYPQMMIVGLSDNNTIYLFKNNQEGQQISQLNYTFESQVSEFLINYNTIIIRILNQEIQIMSLNFTNTFILNQQVINSIFKNIKFNPIQIVQNTQLFSNFLYINNINNVIIVTIDQNNQPIPNSLIQVNYTIKQINLVNQQLILSYICDNGQNICFQVWNIENLPNFYYVKSLQRVNFDNNIIIQSDNLFFYVTFSNLTFYVYNPLLSYHMSLYYMNVLTSPIKCTLAFIFPQTTLYENSIIFYENSYYQLSNFQYYDLIYNLENLTSYYQKTYPQVIYNYFVTSALNQSAVQSTLNQSISFLVNFTMFQSVTIQQVHLNEYNLINTQNTKTKQLNSMMISIPMNLIIDRQVNSCKCIYPEYCSIDQSLRQTKNTQNFSLITSINNQFFALQNNSFIYIVNADFITLSNLSYDYLNFSECLSSTSNNYKLYSICQNNSSQYWLTFSLNSSGFVIQPQLIQLSETFSTIYKIRSLLNQYYILGNINYQAQQLYWINQTTNTSQQIFYFSDADSYCQDFSIGELTNTTIANTLSKTIIISSIIKYLIEEQNLELPALFYQLMQIDDQSITLTKQFSFQIQFCDQQYACQYVNIYPNNILILETDHNDVTLLIGNIDNSYIIELKVQVLQTQSIATVIQTIPNYGSQINLGNSFYQDGYLMQQFSYNYYYLVGFYNLNNLGIDNIFEPILMYNSFTSYSNQYAMIINKTNLYQNGISLSIYNQSIIQSYQINTWNISTVIFSSKNDINVSISCSNNFSEGIYNITFHLPPYFDLNFRKWIYAMLFIIVLLIVLFCYKIQQQRRKYQSIDYEIEL